MKLSIETYILRERLGDKRGIAAIADAGFDAVDYSFYWAKDEKDALGEDYADRAREIRGWIDAAGIVCNQTHAPLELKAGDAFDESNPTYVRLVRSLEASAILGAEHVIVHRVVAPEGMDETEYAYSFYTSLRPYCERFGIKVAVENLFKKKDGVYQGVFGTPEALTDIVRRLGTDCFTACLDIGHTTFAGTPKPEVFLMGMDGSILHALHVHDNDFSGDQHQFPWNGKVDWNAVAKALAAIGYPGDLTLEVFRSLQKYPAALLPDALRFAAALGRHLIGMITENR